MAIAGTLPVGVEILSVSAPGAMAVFALAKLVARDGGARDTH
jgi:hypothetical protein